MKVWYERDADEPSARAVAVALETEVWPVLIERLGMEPPRPDGGLMCNGRDPALDVYLVSVGFFDELGGKTMNAAADCHQSPVWIELDRSMTIEELKAAATHEFMHAVQWSYKTKACKTDYGWLLDATANWAIDHVYAINNFEHMHAPWFMESPEKSLDDPVRNSGKDGRDYGAYLFFQFLTKTVGADVIRAIWQATVDVPSSLEAVNAVIPGGFKQQWPKFAKSLWNRPPVSGESFQAWDGLTAVPALSDKLPVTTSGDLNGLPEAKTELGTRLRNLSISYYHFTFDDALTRSLLFYNPFFENFTRKENVDVKALWSTEEGGWAEESWTDYEFISLCRDLKLQRAKELVIIISSSEWSLPGQVLVASGAPYLMRSNIGCYSYEGTVMMTDKHSSWRGPGRRAQGNLVFELEPRYRALSVTNPAFPNSKRAWVGSLLPLTGENYEFEVHYSAGSCNFNAGPVAYQLPPGGGFLMTNPFPEIRSTTPDLARWLAQPRRAYSAAAGDTQFITVNVTGPGCDDPEMDMVGSLLMTNDGDANRVVSPPIILPTGEMKGGFSYLDLHFEWSLHPVRER